MSASESNPSHPRIDVRVESAKAPQFEVGTRWKVVASSPESLWEGAYTVTFERIEFEGQEG